MPGEADFVDLVVSANDCQDDFLSGDVKQRFERVGCLGVATEEGDHLFDRAGIGRFDLL